MQELIGEAVRWLGFAALWLVTAGRYAGGGSDDHLREGAFGLVVIALVSFIAIKFSM